MKHILYPIYLNLIAATLLFNLLAQRYRLRGCVIGLVNTIWAAITILFMFAASEPWDVFHDFRVGYYTAGKLAFTDPAGMYDASLQGFVNLPIVALLFTPLAAFEEYQAGVLFTAAGIAAITLGWWMLVRLAGLRGWRRWALAGMFVVSGPLFYSVRQGNSTHLLLPVLAGALLCLQSNRQTGAGVLLAVAAVIKPPLMLLPAYFGLRCRWRVALASAAVVGFAGLSSLLVFGLEVNQIWYERSIRPFAGKPMPAYNAQSIPCALARQVTPNEIDGPDAWVPMMLNARLKAVNTTLVGLLAAGTLLLCLFRGGMGRAAADYFDICLVLCLTMLISPVCWSHYYLLLLIPAALCLGGRLGVPARRGWIGAVSLAFLLMSLPVRGWAAGPWWVRLAVSHCLTGGLLLLGALAAARWQLARQVAASRPIGNLPIAANALPSTPDAPVWRQAA
jgi:hypothetical protein